MKTLHLLDTKQFIYSGVKVPNAIRGKVETIGSSLVQKKVAVGGIAFLFNTLKAYSDSTIVACCDRFPAIKTDMYTKYKEKQKEIQKSDSLRELEEDIKRLK